MSRCAEAECLPVLPTHPSLQVRTEAAELLEKVKLTYASHMRSSAYSGGMKRRLSVAISLLGDPKVRLKVRGLCVVQLSCCMFMGYQIMYACCARHVAQQPEGAYMC